MSFSDSTALTILLLACELAFSALALLTIFRLRDRLGLGPLFLLVGANQIMSVLLATSVYFRVSPSIVISPGSAILFPTALVAVLVVYLREDIPKTRMLIYSIVLINVGGVFLLWITALQMRVLDFENILGVPLGLFAIEGRVFLVGTIVLLLDFFVLVILYQFLERRASWIPRWARIVLALVLVMAFDSVLFSFGTFYGEDGLGTFLRGQVAGKTAAAAIYGAFVAIYLRLFEPEFSPLELGTESLDVLSILTYQERYEIVSQKLREEREASLAKSRFLAHMSHELRTPLNAIIGFTRLLMTPDGVPDADKRLLYLDRVHENSRHLLLLINDLLDLSKIEAGKLELDFARVDLGILVAETTDHMCVQAREKGLQLVYENRNAELELETDATRLKQILINLISNAIKFTPEGEVRVRIEASPGRPNAPRRIDIIDTGIGIPPRLHDSIFEAFSQADSGTSRVFEGSGLGLAISRALCNELGYRLEVQSQEGAGATFSVFLD